MKRFPFRAVVIVAALIAAVVLFAERGIQRPEDLTSHRSLEKETPTSKDETIGPETEAPVQSQPIAIIIDDIGFDLQIVRKLASLPLPVSFAILPYTPHAVEAARLLHAAGKEILLHFPMESVGYPDVFPGEGALTTDMTAGEIRSRVREAVAAVPFISGVNNHMGSRFMEDGARLAVVMEELKAKNLFFIDSLTTESSRGRESAKRAGVRFAARDIFIDHVPGRDAALKNLTGVVRKERTNGLPILMIGHPHRETELAIRAAIPIWQAEGIQVISISACLGDPRGEKSETRRQQQAEP